jgi:SAM-dependent methyltransferase
LQYVDVWRPGDEGEAMQLIMVTRDAERFELVGEQMAAQLAAYCTPATVALDLGAGIGRVSRHLAPHVREVVLVDISEEMLAFARERLAGIPNARFVRSAATSVPNVADGSIDFLFSVLVLQHLEREDAFLALQEVRRMLRSDGRAYLTFPNLLSDMYLESFLQYARSGEVANPARARFYTPPEVERLLLAAGLAIERLDVDTEIVALVRRA